MKGKKNVTGEDPAGDADCVPVRPAEIGPADYNHMLFVDDDSDEEFVLVDYEDIDLDDVVQLVPHQAVEFLVNAAQEQQLAEIPVESEDEDADQEVDAQQNDEVVAPGNLPELMNVYIEEEAQQASAEASADENQQPMEVLAGIQNEPEDAESNDKELVEDQELRLAGELVEVQESVWFENDLNQEQNFAQQAGSPPRFVENLDQELNTGSATSGFNQEVNGRLSSSNEIPIEEQVQKGLSDLEEAMEGLEVHHNVASAVSDVEVQENTVGQIEGKILVAEGAIEVQDNVVKDNMEVSFNPFIAKQSFYDKRLYVWRIKDDGY